MKNYYALLELQPTASADAIKHAFRQQIARYHPDKVQHLGAEFQALAADRAAELTEAYRVLSDGTQRAAYDRQFSAAAGASVPQTPAATATSPTPDTPAAAPRAEPVAEPEGARPGHGFSDERARSDAFVRKAVLNRFRHAVEAAMGDSLDHPTVRGFDAAVAPKPKLFSRGRGPHLLARFVPRVDPAAIADAWSAALKWVVPDAEDVCILLMGADMASPRELALAIAEQRRRPTRGQKVSVVPIDARDWQAHLPVDVPPLVRTLVERLQNPSG